MAEICTYSAEVQKIAELLVCLSSAHSDTGITHSLSVHTHVRLYDFTTLREGSWNNELPNIINAASMAGSALKVWASDYGRDNTLIPDQFCPRF